MSDRSSSGGTAVTSTTGMYRRPYVREAAYLAAVYPHVYLDCGLAGEIAEDSRRRRRQAHGRHVMGAVEWTGRSGGNGVTRDHWSDGTTTDPADDPPKDRQ